MLFPERRSTCRPLRRRSGAPVGRYHGTDLRETLESGGHSMLFSCTPASPHPMRVASKRGSPRHFTLDIHCHVIAPEAEKLVQSSVKTDFEPMVRHANEATREVNRQQNEAIRDKI